VFGIKRRSSLVLKSHLGFAKTVQSESMQVYDMIA